MTTKCPGRIQTRIRIRIRNKLASRILILIRNSGSQIRKKYLRIHITGASTERQEREAVTQCV
jgi:hypothetical protein